MMKRLDNIDLMIMTFFAGGDSKSSFPQMIQRNLSMVGIEIGTEAVRTRLNTLVKLGYLKKSEDRLSPAIYTYVKK